MGLNVPLTEDQIHEADYILRRRECARNGHDYDIQLVISKNMPSGIVCTNCGESWRVFHPVDSPTIAVKTIDAPTHVMPKIH